MAFVVDAKAQTDIIGNQTVQSIDAYPGGDLQCCEFQFTGATGQYTGTLNVYFSRIDSNSNYAKAVFGIYDATGNRIAISAEKSGLKVGWNSQALSGSFSLTNGVGYRLAFHCPAGDTAWRMDTSSIAQHGWKTIAYGGTLPSTLTATSTNAYIGSIYASLQLAAPASSTPPSQAPPDNGNPPASPTNPIAIIGNQKVQSIDAYPGGHLQCCEFQFTGSTGQYTGMLYVYFSRIEGDYAKAVFGIYDATGNRIATSAEKSGLKVGWNSQALSGSFSLTNGVGYRLAFHCPAGATAWRMDTSSIAQHGWKAIAYDGTLPSTLTATGTNAYIGSIYASLQLAAPASSTPPSQAPPDNGNPPASPTNPVGTLGMKGVSYFEWGHFSLDNILMLQNLGCSAAQTILYLNDWLTNEQHPLFPGVYCQPKFVQIRDWLHSHGMKLYICLIGTWDYLSSSDWDNAKTKVILNIGGLQDKWINDVGKLVSQMKPDAIDVMAEPPDGISATSYAGQYTNQQFIDAYKNLIRRAYNTFRAIKSDLIIVADTLPWYNLSSGANTVPTELNLPIAYDMYYNIGGTLASCYANWEKAYFTATTQTQLAAAKAALIADLNSRGIPQTPNCFLRQAGANPSNPNAVQFMHDLYDIAQAYNLTIFQDQFRPYPDYGSGMLQSDWKTLNAVGQVLA